MHENTSLLTLLSTIKFVSWHDVNPSLIKFNIIPSEHIEVPEAKHIPLLESAKKLVVSNN